MMKHANCVVSIMFARIVRVAAVAVLVPVLAVQNRVVSSRKENRSVARWEPTQRIRVLVLRVAPAQHLARNVHTTPVLATIISATVLKVPMAIVVRVRPAHKVIVRKATVLRIKTVARALQEIARKVIVRRIRTVALAHKVIVHREIVRLTKIVAHVHHVRPMPTRPNSVAGTCPMVSIQAHA